MEIGILYLDLVVWLVFLEKSFLELVLGNIKRKHGGQFRGFRLVCLSVNCRFLRAHGGQFRLVLHYPVIVSSIILKLITFNVGEIGLLGTQTDMKSLFFHYILAPFGTRKEKN